MFEVFCHIASKHLINENTVFFVWGLGEGKSSLYVPDMLSLDLKIVGFERDGPMFQVFLTNLIHAFKQRPSSKFAFTCMNANAVADFEGVNIVYGYGGNPHSGNLDHGSIMDKAFGSSTVMAVIDTKLSPTYFNNLELPNSSEWELAWHKRASFGKSEYTTYLWMRKIPVLTRSPDIAKGARNSVVKTLIDHAGTSRAFQNFWTISHAEIVIQTSNVRFPELLVGSSVLETFSGRKYQYGDGLGVFEAGEEKCAGTFVGVATSTQNDNLHLLLWQDNVVRLGSVFEAYHPTTSQKKPTIVQVRTAANNLSMLLQTKAPAAERQSIRVCEQKERKAAKQKAAAKQQEKDDARAAQRSAAAKKAKAAAKKAKAAAERAAAKKKLAHKNAKAKKKKVKTAQRSASACEKPNGPPPANESSPSAKRKLAGTPSPAAKKLKGNSSSETNTWSQSRTGASTSIGPEFGSPPSSPFQPKNLGADMLDASNLGANMLNVETLHEKLLHKLTVQLSDSAAQRQATELEHKAILESNAFAVQKLKHEASMRKTELKFQVKLAAIEATQRNQVKPANEQELQQKATVESNAFAMQKLKSNQEHEASMQKTGLTYQMHLAAAQVTNGIQPNQVKPANDCVRSSPCDWSVEDVAQWLGDKHCTRDVIEKFKENQVCGSTLTCMTDEVMQEHILPWFSVLHRDKFVQMMKTLKTSK